MSEKTKTVVEAARPVISYRNIKKDFTEFNGNDSITKNFHLELGENYETVVIEDHPDDWFEMTQKDADKVGLANIIRMLANKGEDPYDGRFSFKDEEAADLSDIDPLDINAQQKLLASQSEATKKLEATAKQLGVSVDELINAFVKGSLSDLIAAKVGESTTKEEKEGE